MAEVINFNSIFLMRTSFSLAGVYGGCFGVSINIFALFCVEKQGPAIRLEKGGRTVAALLKNRHHLFGL